MITKEGVEVADTVLIGVERSSWVIKLFYNDERSAADWLAQGYGESKRVYRVRLDLIEELKYVPPVPASLRVQPVELLRIAATQSLPLPSEQQPREDGQ